MENSLIGKKPLLTVFVKGNHKINATVACSDKPKIADLSNLPEIEMTDHYEKEEMIMGIFRLCKDMRTPNFQGENLDTFHTEHAA